MSIDTIPTDVEFSILQAAGLQAVRRQVSRSLGRWYVMEHREHGGPGSGAVRLERLAYARRAREWRARARARGLRPADVRRAVLVAHEVPRPAPAPSRRPAR